MKNQLMTTATLLILLAARPTTALFYLVWGSTAVHPGQSLFGTILVKYVSFL